MKIEKIEKTTEKVLKFVALASIIIFVVLSIITITIPSFKQNFLSRKKEVSGWEETEDRLAYRSYGGSLKARWGELNSGEDKPLIELEHGLSWIELTSIVASSSFLTITQNDNTYVKNIFWDHYLHLKTGKELQAGWISKEGDYVLLQKVSVHKKDKLFFVRNSYSLTKKDNEKVNLLLTNKFFSGEAIFIPRVGWNSLKRNLEEKKQTSISFKLKAPYYILYSEKEDVSFLVFCILSKIPASIKIKPEREGIKILELVVPLEEPFHQSFFVKLLYDKEREDVTSSFIEKQVNKIFE